MTEIILGIYLIGVAFTFGWSSAQSWAMEILMTIPAWKVHLMNVTASVIWPAVMLIVLWAFWQRRGY